MMKLAYQSARDAVDAAIQGQDPKVVAAAVRAVAKERDPLLAIELAVGVPKANRQALQAVVLAAKNPRAAYMWAFTFPDADLRALAEVVKSSTYYGFEFERQFGSLDNPVRHASANPAIPEHTLNDVPVKVLERLTVGGMRHALVRLPDGGRTWVRSDQLRRPQ